MVMVGGDLFRKGSLVEVGSNEEGFKDAWYEATIVKPPWKSSTSNRKNKALVQYQTLVTEEGSRESKPLTEYVHAAMLRPSPPKETQSFEPHDVVDAFYRDGWWTGVVTRVVEENSRYSVFFLNPPEEIEFPSSDLRVHFEWVKGKWVRSQKQMTTGLIFSTGTPVELNFEKDSSRDVWFPATFVKEIGINSFLVEYQSTGHGDEAGLQNATVDCLHIRPSPPCLEDKNFELLEKVDAFYDLGWRVGMITKVLSGRRYVVTLKHPEEEKELSHLEIRPHLEWNGGKWVSNSREINQEKGGGMSSQMKRKGRPDTVPFKRRQASAEGKEHDGAVGTAVEMVVKECTELPTITGVVSTVIGGSQPEISFQHSGKEYLKRLRNRKLLNEPARHKNMEINQEKGGMSSKMKRKGRPRTVPVKRLKASAAGAAIEMVVKDDNELPTITGVLSTGIGGSQPELSFQHPGKEYLKRIRDEKLLNEPARQKNIEINEKKEDGMSIQMKRRGRPPKVMVKMGKASAGKAHDGAVGAAVEMVVKDWTELPTITEVVSRGIGGSQPEILFQHHVKEYLKRIRDKKLLNKPARHKNIVNNIKRIPIVKKGKLPNEIVGQVLGKHLEKHSGKRGRKRCCITMNTEPPSQASQEAAAEEVVEISGTDCMKKVPQMVVAEISSNISEDDQPLLMWFEGMHSSTPVDDSRLSPGITDKQLKEARERQVDTASVPDENQSLPFLKSSPVWETIESMELFQKMPQKPHFHPLNGCKEECREGLAIANMVTFTNLVEGTSKLQFDGPRSIFTGILEALHDLEMHGFDVKAVQGRLNELLSIKNRQEQLQGQSKQVESQILECKHEQTNIDEEIDEIDKIIRELEEKRALVMSRKEIKDSEIATLQLSVNAINEGMRSVQLDFERLVAAPW